MPIHNDTEHLVHTGVVLDHDGEKLLTVVKGTFALRRGDDQLVQLCRAEARPIRHADEPWGDPRTTPPKYPCDTAPRKHATDVIVAAKGHAPGGRPTEAFDVAITVGPLHKALRVFGVRAWLPRGEGLSAPRPLTEQEIRYDAAWGGTDLSDPDSPVGDPRNPVGRGVVRDPEALTHQLAPCIEDPRALIADGTTNPAPAGFGPMGPHWWPRRDHAGTHDREWRRSQAPLPPTDRDDRHFQCASPGLVADPPLRGGERVELWNLTPGGGALSFALPTCRVAVEHELRGVSQGVAHPHLDTVIVDTLRPSGDAIAIVELAWRTLTPMPRRPTDATVRVTRARSGP